MAPGQQQKVRARIEDKPTDGLRLIDSQKRGHFQRGLRGEKRKERKKEKVKVT